jgi:hypothetical protein
VTVATASSKEPPLVDVLPVYPLEVLEDLAFSELHASGYEAFPGMGGPVEPGIAPAHVSLLGITKRRGKDEIVEIPLNFHAIALQPPANAPFDPATIDLDNLRSNIKRRQLERWTTAMIKQYKEDLIHDIEFGVAGD